MGGELGETPGGLWKGYYRDSRPTTMKENFFLSPLDFANTLKIIAANSPGESIGLSGAGC